MNSLKTKLTIYQGLVGFAGILLIVSITWLVSRQRILSNAIAEAENLSDQIAYSMVVIAAQGGDATFNYQRLIEKTSTLNNVSSIKVLDEKGVILADNDHSQVGQVFNSPLLEDSLKNQRKEQQIEGRSLIVVRPLRGETYTANLNDVTGFLWIELDFTPAYARAQEDMSLILAVSLGGFLLTFYWYYRVTQNGILDRLSVLSSGLIKVENGDLTQRISIRKLFGSTDEINELASQFNRMTASLHQKLTFEELTSHLSAKFMNVPFSEMDTAVHDTLRRLGELFKVDRTYIFEFTDDGLAMNNTFEWCANEIIPQIDNLQGVPREIVPWWMQLLENGEIIIIPRVSEMPKEAASERQILSEQGIQSVLVTPMTSDHGLFGFIGFDSVAHERNWTKEEVNLLSMLSGVVANTLIRQRSQREVVEERDFALQVMETVAHGLIVADLDGSLEYTNPAYAKMLKYTAQEITGRKIQEFMHIEDIPQDETQNSYTAQMRLIAKDGTVVNTLVSRSPRIKDGHIKGSIGAVVDLTEQLLAEEKLRQSEARNRAFLNAIPDLIFRMDEAGRFIDFKAGDDSRFYIPPEEIIGASVADIFPAEVSNMTLLAIKNSLQTSKPQSFEYKLQTPSGLFTYEARVAASSPGEVIAVIHDITERARLEQMKTDFINRASHELRTPLTTALLMVNLLERSYIKPEEREEYWQILTQELNRERIILEDVLTVGRLEAGKYRIADGLVSIMPVLKSAIDSMQLQASMRNVEFQVDAPETPPDLRGTEEVFARIFSNIVSNAVKFSRPETSIQVRVIPNADGMSVEVQDHGIGIPPEDLPHITSRFFRGTNATEMEIPGSGIGLYIIKALTEELGGKLGIQSKLNDGTTISLWFPIPSIKKDENPASHSADDWSVEKDSSAPKVASS